MELPLYQVDAFARRPFGGNPAAVCPLERWLPDETMQAIAAENNQAETAFFVPAGEDFELRWFTPTIEMDLCGHATLASGFVIATLLTPGRRTTRFLTRSGPLTVSRHGELFALDLPTRAPAPWPARADAVAAALGRRPAEALKAKSCLAVFADEAEVRALAPDMAKVAALDCAGVIVTAPGTDVDFVSRYFAPHAGIPEDPVTGSAHCTLTPFWAERLGKSRLTARQVSRRGGELQCEDHGARTVVAGHAALYLTGRIVV